MQPLFSEIDPCLLEQELELQVKHEGLFLISFASMF